MTKNWKKRKMKVFEQLVKSMTADEMRYFEQLLRSMRIKKEEEEKQNG